ncbi:DUF58 domain-containing protein [Candidatus Woesearchaeota archaeon]|nr:DUF58 domain-containing protein [Candidatus Woesearchaeota archaeon]
MKEFKVNIAPAIKDLDLVSKKSISGWLSGDFRSILKGTGLEFRGYRKYNVAEDDAKLIDWKASLRSRYLVVKEMIEEKNNNVMFFVDVSSSMSFGSTDKLKNEYAIEMVASMAHALMDGGDSAGLTLFSDKIIRTIPANTGKKHYYNMIHTITDPKLYEGSCNMEKAIHDLTAILLRRSIVILVTDFIGMKGNWFERMRSLAAKHELIIFIVQDPRDISVPAETGPVFIQDPFTHETLLIDTKEIKEDYDKHAQEQKEQLSKKLKSIHVDFMFIRTDGAFAKTLFSYFKERSMRWAHG